MLHVGVCPVCENGVGGVRLCHDHAVVVCEECESVWLDPDLTQRPTSPPAPDTPCPVCRHPLYGDETAWATAQQVADLGWSAAVEGEIDRADTQGGFPPPLVVAVRGDAGDWSAAVDAAPQTTAEGEPEAELIAEPFEEAAIRSALEAGRHVLAAMPWAEDLKAVRGLADLAAEKRLTLGPLLGWPSHPRSKAIRRLLDGGSLGEFRRLVCGVSQADGVNAIDGITVAAWFFGESPEKVVTVANGRGVVVVLTFGDRTATLDMAGQLKGRQWVELVGSTASLVCDDLLTPWTEGPSRFWVHGDHGKQSEELVLPADGRQEAVAALYRSARTATPPDSGWALAAHEVLHRVYEQVASQADGPAA